MNSIYNKMVNKSLKYATSFIRLETKTPNRWGDNFILINGVWIYMMWYKFPQTSLFRIIPSIREVSESIFFYNTFFTKEYPLQPPTYHWAGSMGQNILPYSIAFCKLL